MQNYYEVLQINRSASSDEIKKAYAKLLRKYHPEKDEENFKKIREAYEILSNPEKRKEYDFQLEYGDEFLEMLQEVEELINLEEYEEARSKLKKLTLIKPNDDRIWVSLAETYAKEGEMEKAIDVLLKARNYVYNSVLIFGLLGIYYQNLERFDSAEFYYKKALEIQKDFYIYERLYFVYLFSKRQNEAEKVLNTISKLELNEFNLIDYRLLLIKHYAITQSTINACESKVGIYVKELIKSAEEKEEIKAYLINQVINELEFYEKTELVFGLYYCWKILYFITNDEDAKERYEILKNILFKNCNESTLNNSSLNKNSSTVTNQKSSSDGGVLGWIILFLVLGSLGPFGIILFFIILYIAKKD